MNIKQLNNLKPPTQELVAFYINKWEDLENYKEQEIAINLLFKELLPKNDKFENVLLKVTVLNKFYSTQILDTYSLSKNIFEIIINLDDRLAIGDKTLVDEISNLDDRLSKGDKTLVDDISKKSVEGQKRSYYSFASKYCSHHNEELFPIIDSFVEKVIIYLIINDNKTIINNKNISDEMKILLSGKLTKKGIQKFIREKYNHFVTILTDIRRVYNLENVSYRDFDKFLWLWGKEMFSKDKSAKTIQ